MHLVLFTKCLKFVLPFLVVPIPIAVSVFIGTTPIIGLHAMVINTLLGILCLSNIVIAFR